MSNTCDGKLPHHFRTQIEHRLVDLGGPRPLTYQELAERMSPKMDKGQLSKIVNGKQRVRFDTLQRIAKALGWSLELQAVDAKLAAGGPVMSD